MQDSRCAIPSRPTASPLRDAGELQMLHDERDKAIGQLDERISELEGRLVGYLRSAPEIAPEANKPSCGIASLDDAHHVVEALSNFIHRIQSITYRLVM